MPQFASHKIHEDHKGFIKIRSLWACERFWIDENSFYTNAKHNDNKTLLCITSHQITVQFSA